MSGRYMCFKSFWKSTVKVLEVRKGQEVQEYEISERSRKFTRSGRFKRSVRSKNSRRFLKC